jgi:hypothetical protein
MGKPQARVQRACCWGVFPGGREKVPAEREKEKNEHRGNESQEGLRKADFSLWSSGRVQVGVPVPRVAIDIPRI